MMTRTTAIAIVTFLLAADSAWAQSSSLYKRGEQGQVGSNQPAPPTAPATPSAEPSDDKTAADATQTDGSAVQASETVCPVPVAQVPVKPAVPMSASVQAGERVTSPSVAALQSASFTATPPPPAREFNVHDLVTIIVREETKYSSDGETDVEKSYDFNAKLDAWIKLRLANLQIAPTDMTLGTPQIKGSADRNFQGEGEVKRSDTFIGRITGEIVDIKPNGTLIVSARKQIKTDDEEQTFEVTGTCRVGDVTADNTVLSTQLADLTVRKVHKGAVRDAQKRGIVPKIVDWLNPF